LHKPAQRSIVRRIFDKVGPDSPAAPFLAAGLEVAGERVSAKDVDAQRRFLQAFEGDELRSKPIGFYTWNPTLESCFRFLRYFQQTFIVGGLNDIFQRGEPLLYEALRDHTTAKLLLGPWQHIGGSQGAGLPKDGVPDLNHIALMWFDQYLKGMNAGAAKVPNVTQYLYGEERYVTTTDWPHPQARAERLYLRADKSLGRELPGAGEGSSTVLQQPLNGICSTSTSQWTAGLLGALPVPCFTENNINENPLFEVTFTTPAMEQDYYVNGPIQADMWISTTAADAGLLVRITDVSPDGSSREITNGILTASLRQVDTSRSRYLNGEMIQPWHPYTEASREAVGSGTPVLLPIEVFPSSFVIKQGHSLRVTVGASDFPHGLPPLADLADQLVGVLTVYSDAERPSSVVLPVVPTAVLEPAS